MTNYETANFSRDVLEASKNTPVVVDFWAEWCGPCRVLGPVLERLQEKDAGRWVLVKVDTDRNQDIASQYGIKGIPSVKMFVDGKVVNEFTGALPERMVRQWLDSSLPDPFRVELERARELLREGEESIGVNILEQVHQRDPNHVEARVLLAKNILPLDPDRAVELVSGIEEDSEHFPLADAVRVVREMNEKHRNPGNLADGPARTMYVSALEKVASGDYDSAIALFIEVIRTDRAYDNNGSRKACVALFMLLGEENATTLKHRRVFARALNV